MSEIDYNKDGRRKRYQTSMRKHKEDHDKPTFRIKETPKDHYKKTKKDYYGEDIDGEIS